MSSAARHRNDSRELAIAAREALLVVSNMARRTGGPLTMQEWRTMAQHARAAQSAADALAGSIQSGMIAVSREAPADKQAGQSIAQWRARQAGQ